MADGAPRRASDEEDLGILATVGNTPLVRLNRILSGFDLALYAKLEGFNPGGSAKDRPATAILKHCLATGQIDRRTVIIESSSGNMGIGLAQACRYFGLRFICVVDPKTAPQNLKMLEVYGAEINHVTDPDPASGEFLQARLARVQELLGKIPGSFWPNQYQTALNPQSHYQTTMHEIVTELGSLDYLFVATSTCGTITGCSSYLRDHGIAAKVVAVDARGSLIFSDKKEKRSVPGIGAGIRPPLCNLDLIDQIEWVSDADCVAGCRRLVRWESVLAGGSSGGVITAVERLAPEIPAGSTVVAILADRGERYLETIYSETWVRDHVGDIADRWEGAGVTPWR
ncbi:MAG TPA: 2,3-diaminopropionate biosynthesis protein SbnA [Thermoanaerobaculia bacterium]|jgi:cysteine synthase A|nr:2,3-diaminopropionate biosynthesis protein SbnA [Thermoanaerobaculia bacterium]